MPGRLNHISAVKTNKKFKYKRLEYSDCGLNNSENIKENYIGIAAAINNGCCGCGTGYGSEYGSGYVENDNTPASAKNSQ